MVRNNRSLFFLRLKQQVSKLVDAIGWKCLCKLQQWLELSVKPLKLQRELYMGSYGPDWDDALFPFMKTIIDRLINHFLY